MKTQYQKKIYPEKQATNLPLLLLPKNIYNLKITNHENKHQNLTNHRISNLA